MEYKISFSKETATIEFGNSDISGKYKCSPDGKLFIVCDTLYSSSSDKEYIFVFTKQDVIYKKAISNDDSADDYYIFNDGKALIIFDEYIIHLDSDGKRLSKVNYSLSFDEYDITDSLFWGIGTNDDGNTALFLYDLTTPKNIIRVIPDLEYDNDDMEDQLSSDATALFTGKEFVFMYPNETDAVVYDLAGEKKIATVEHVDLAKKKKRRADEAQRQDKINRIRANYDYWHKRLMADIKARKPADEIAKDRANVETFKNELLAMGETVPQELSSDNTVEEKKKKGFLARLLNL